MKDAKKSSSTISASIIVDFNVNYLNIPLQIYILMPFFFSHSEKLQMLSLMISRLLSTRVIMYFTCVSAFAFFGFFKLGLLDEMIHGER